MLSKNAHCKWRCLLHHVTNLPRFVLFITSPPDYQPPVVILGRHAALPAVPPGRPPVTAKHCMPYIRSNCVAILSPAEAQGLASPRLGPLGPTVV